MSQKKYSVYFTAAAEADLVDIYEYIKFKDSIESAKYVIEKIKEQSFKLSSLPKRGHIIPGFEKIGIRNFRAVYFKPYQIIFEIENSDVFVDCILDGRRDLQEILERRLLR